MPRHSVGPGMDVEIVPDEDAMVVRSVDPGVVVFGIAVFLADEISLARAVGDVFESDFAPLKTDSRVIFGAVDKPISSKSQAPIAWTRVPCVRKIAGVGGVIGPAGHVDRTRVADVVSGKKRGCG